MYFSTSPSAGLTIIANVAIATVLIGNPERHMRKASHRGSKQQ